MVEPSMKDMEFREEALGGRIWPLIIKVCFPLAIFQGISQLFSIIDSLMASHISSNAVSTVVYLVQLNKIVSAIGSALAVACSIALSHAYGAGEYRKVKRILSTSIALATIFGVAILALLPFSNNILKITGTPEPFIEEGSSYFSISMISVIVNFLNLIYISTEKTRGKSKKILFLNLMTVLIKLSLTAIFVYLFDGGIIDIAIATLISNIALLLFAIISLSKKNDIFSFSITSISLKWDSIQPLLKLAFPSMIEKMAFSFGKSTVNKMASNYGTNAVGAAGISNNMSGLLTGLQVGFQDGGASILGQAFGAKKEDRLRQLYRRIQILIVITGLVGFGIFYVISPWIAKLFSLSRGGYDNEFFSMIVTIYHYELWGTMFLSFNYASTSLLLGCGKTKLTLAVNFARIFIFRIPIIWAFQTFSTLGYEAVGITMAISNALTGLFGLVVAEYVLKMQRRKVYV